jgi:hypothetical protein
VYLVGYWQSENYFRDKASIIRSDFDLQSLTSAAVESLGEDPRSCDSISIHVRRGDYVANQRSNAYHGVLEREYYLNAARIMATRVHNPKFFVFSDDMAWCRANLFLDWPTVYATDVSGLNSHFHLCLMSACKHQIIANSSYSWWGAWLNNSDDKVVIAPKCWFASRKTPPSLLPTDWVTI